MTNMLQPELDIDLSNLDIKEEPIDIYPEDSADLLFLDLNIKEEIKEEIADTYFNNNVTDEQYASIGQPNTANLDHFNHDHASLFMKEQPNELSTTETDSDISINDILSPKAPLTQLSRPTLTQTEISEKIEDITSDINNHISEHILKSGRKSCFAFQKENKNDEESKAMVEDGMIPPIDGESKSSSKIIRQSPVRNQEIKNLLNAESLDKKKLSRYQYIELNRLKIDMVVGKRRRSKSINSDEEKPSLSSAANQTTSGRNSTKHQVKSIHSDQMPYRHKFLDVRSRSLIRPKLEPVLTEANTPESPEGSVDESLLQDNTYSCSKCSFTSDKKRTIINHEYQHHILTNSSIYKCAFCSQTYTRRSLILHMKTMHPQQKYNILDKDIVYKCPECDYLADSSLLLSQHVKSHKSLTLECPYCEYKSTPKDLSLHINICKMNNTILKCSNINLEEQIDSKHNSGKFNCEICAFSCDDVELFNLHNLLHGHYKKKISKSCPYCGLRTTVKSLEKHMYLIHNIGIEGVEKEENDLTTLKCTKCSFSTKLPEELKSHMKSHNNYEKLEEDIFKCKKCSFENDVLSVFLDHQLTHQPNNEKKTKYNPNFSLSELDVHMDKHKYTSSQGALKYQRSLSEMEIALPDELSLKQNYLIDHDYSKLQLDCVEDDPGALTADNSHLQNQTSCQAQLISPQELPLHKQVHSKNDNENDYVPTMTEHEKQIKTDDKNDHKCKSSDHKEVESVCRMKQLDVLNRGPYRCDKCSFSARLKHYLFRHQRTHQQNQPIGMCSYCPFRSTRRQLRDHVRRIHAGGARSKKAQVNNPAHVGEISNIENSLNNVPINGETNPRFYCSHCPYSTNLRIKMNSHIEKEHLNSVQRDAVDSSSLSLGSKPTSHIFNCPLCPFTTDLRIKLNRHVKKAHPSVKLINCTIYQCTFCSWRTSVEALLKRHRNAHFLYNLPIFMCQYCNFKGSKNHVIRFHSYCTLPPKCRTLPPLRVALNCPICSFSCYYPADLKRHAHDQCQNFEKP
ncbi:unnamed protein product [Ceutorhynchus assimilis]|uniref:C2H2-type domain-containing protein n=1 Tax=Ceutorhynchus assimilis TaxID=467358 RepID=A0A9N9QJE6_9CUCU|nr:unnamed protein product [Ceutorhynchus assimilis]